jgi:hypothetical protein
MSISEQARTLIVRQQLLIKKRQKSMLIRTSAEIGFDSRYSCVNRFFIEN